MRRSSFILLLSLLLLSFANSSSFPILQRTGAAPVPQAASDTSLAAVRRSDAAIRTPKGKLGPLSAAEHLRRASVYMTNRAFAEAREHWQAVLTMEPQSPGTAEALFGIGRSYFQDRQYKEAFTFLQRVARDYPSTKEGREGLTFSAAASLRLGNLNEAVERYRKYTEQYPGGERFESAHLNLIDTLREADRPKEAIQWISRTREKFAGTPTATNALFARLRLDVAEGNWKHAVAVADELAAGRFPKGVLTTRSEVLYLKAYCLEQAGRREEALNTYSSIPDGMDSYYGWLATERLQRFGNGKAAMGQRSGRAAGQIAAGSSSFPAPYRAAIVKAARTRKIDARFVLAIIKQESVFKPFAKSPSGARGLLQLTMDAAQRYAAEAGVGTVTEAQLYRPETSILLGSEYLAELFRMFPNQPEAVAASYNGGEDNVARWLKRAKQKDAGVFTSEIGFDETKAYVQKVMANYRAYQQLYTADLTPR
jgi:soluble lytic murein transglycosylase